MTSRMMLLAGAALVLAPAMASAGSPEAPAKQPAATAKTYTAPKALVALVNDFTIPYQTFTLPNGLKVIVLTDRSVPVVFTSITYNVGSTFEPAGRSGFAHLFEHLMFNGSENVPGDYFEHLRDAGLIGINGGTDFDLTNYYEVVPKGSLDRVLFMESDRMGHLLGAVTQSVLDEQRGVVQNEKRNGDNNPSSIFGYSKRAAIYPASHPYGHSVIGSMKDLNAASLADVHQWFKDYYGPNNATLLLAGDIDVATAKAKVAQYFGDIPRGRDNSVPTATVPVLRAPIEQTLTGPVATATIFRTWPVPGALDKTNFALDAVSSLMTGIDGAPLTEKLVRQDKLFNYINANNATNRGVGEFTIAGSVRKGVDPEVAARALDAAIAAFLKSVPTAEALDRWKSTRIIPTVRNNEMLEARGGLLMQMNTVFGTPAAYKDDLKAYLALTPDQVMAAAHAWLERPAYRATLKPGPRMTPPGDESVAGAEVADAPNTAVVPPQTGTRGPLPVIGAPDAIRPPVIQHARLANGIPVLYVQHKTVPFTQANLRFDFGTVDDPAGKPGVINRMFQMLDEGAGGHDDHWFSQFRERSGVVLGGGAQSTSSSLFVQTPTASLGETLDVVMLMLTRPDFPADRLEEARRRDIARITAAPESPGALLDITVARTLAPGSLMAQKAAIPTLAEVNAITRADLKAAFSRWVRPDQAELVIVSDEPLDALLPRFNATLGRWTAQGRGPAPKPLTVKPALATGPAKIVLIDMPGQVQSAIIGGQMVDMPRTDEALAPRIANLALGSGFLSRINMNLREDKHWSYGAGGSFNVDDLGSSYRVETQVQPDKVGPAIAEIQREVNDILTSRPITPKEFDQGVAGVLRESTAGFRTGGQVLAALDQLQRNHWPDDFFSGFSGRLKALTIQDADAALHRYLQPSKWVWTVVGDAKQLRPQLEKLGLPIEVLTPAKIVAKH
ncbi:pitrilysin family protein [uncultured Sphingomonas sp.]|uniref:M16 family metallopeptidase n=1 Tax=uncultured Sphingomonas sp. TaxID=158754 RepID=UPI0025CCCF38|nr:pitrilysin family protein [uncultured Sphingomonas sp.]